MTPMTSKDLEDRFCRRLISHISFSKILKSQYFNFDLTSFGFLLKNEHVLELWSFELVGVFIFVVVVVVVAIVVVVVVVVAVA